MLNGPMREDKHPEGLLRSLDDMRGTIEYAAPEVLMMLNQSPAASVTPGVSSVQRTSASLDSLASFDSSSTVNDRSGVHVVALDTWALGVVLYAMLFGIMPFNNAQRRMMAAFGKHPTAVIPPRALETPSELSDAMDLLRKMLALNPRERLSLDDIRHHPWVAEEYATRFLSHT
jgi:serine/threonine protein kinase